MNTCTLTGATFVQVRIFLSLTPFFIIHCTNCNFIYQSLALSYSSLFRCALGIHEKKLQIYTFEGTQINFDKQSSATTTTYNVEYDYGSVMHYSAGAFSRNGQPTITPKVRFIYILIFQHLPFNTSFSLRSLSATQYLLQYTNNSNNI